MKQLDQNSNTVPLAILALLLAVVFGFALADSNWVKGGKTTAVAVQHSDVSGTVGSATPRGLARASRDTPGSTTPAQEPGK